MFLAAIVEHLMISTRLEYSSVCMLLSRVVYGARSVTFIDLLWKYYVCVLRGCTTATVT